MKCKICGKQFNYDDLRSGLLTAKNKAAKLYSERLGYLPFQMIMV